MTGGLYKQEFEDLCSTKLVSQDDIRAQELVKSSITYTEGHHTIGLPWRCSLEMLPNNRKLAMVRLKCLRNKLLKDPTLLSKYQEVMNNYIRSGYASKICPGNVGRVGEPRWYLPHYAVINPRKPEKIRVVFDCAAEYLGWSSNKCLLSGPNMVSDLVAVLLRFRENYIGIVADIKEMFLQVRVPEKDRSLSRFLWWNDNNLGAIPDEFQLNVHLFGATSSPFCANFALRRTAEDFCSDHSIQRVIDENFYVDDCLVSVDDINEARRLVSGLAETLNKGGFQLTKWVSNDSSALSNMHKSDCISGMTDLDQKHNESTDLRFNVGLLV